MDELIGTLLPLLLNGSGANIGDVLRMLTGAADSTGYDGLKAMRDEQFRRLMWNNPMMPSQQTITSGARSFVENLGIVPNSQVGQAATDLISGMYRFAPSVVGTMIGVHDPSQFMQGIVNSASGIGVASGIGPQNIFNPASVHRSYENALGLGQVIYDMATDRGDGRRGFNIGFTHGLNMDEVGRVSQRVLSSQIPYLDEAGNRLDLSSEKDVDKFKDNLKTFTSKINEAVSMVNKVTGSFEETLRIFDSMAGGNAFGGTADQAMAVANKAKEMAANIRITSAIAGIDPKDSYQRISNFKSAFVGSFSETLGKRPDGLYIARSTGLDASFSDTAYSAAMAYNVWLAQHPGASEQDKAQARIGTEERTKAYADAPAAKLVGIIAAHRNLFTDEQISESAYKLSIGDVSGLSTMVKDVVGNQTFYEGMTNKGLALSYQITGDRETLARLHSAGIEGNRQEAVREGTKRRRDTILRDVNESVNYATGRTGSRSRVQEEKGILALRKLALGEKEDGLSMQDSANMSEEQLREWLNERGYDANVVEQVYSTGMIDEAMEDIRNNTMTEREESAARKRLRGAINQMYANSPGLREEFIKKLDNGADVGELADKVFSKSRYKSADKRRQDLLYVTQGRLSRRQAAREIERLRPQSELNRTGFTPGERNVGTRGAGGLIPTEGTSNQRFNDFVSNIADMQSQGLAVLNLGDYGGDVSQTLMAGMSGMLEDIRKQSGSGIGDGTFGIASDRFKNHLLDAMKDGGEWDDSVQQAFQKTAIDMRVSELEGEGKSKDEALRQANAEAKNGNLGGVGAQIMRMASKAKGSNAMSQDRFMKDTAKIIQTNTVNSVGIDDPMKDPLQIKQSKGESDQDTMARFASAANARFNQGLLVKSAGDEDGLMTGSFGRGAAAGFKRSMSRFLDGMETDRQKDIIDTVTADALERLKGGSSWGEARRDAMNALLNNESLKLSDEEKKSLKEAIAGDADSPQTVDDLLYDTGHVLLSNTKGFLGGVGSLYTLANDNRNLDSGKQNSEFLKRLKELQKSGQINVKDESEDLSVTRKAGARSALDTALNGVEKNLFSDQWRSDQSEKVSNLIASGMSVNRAVATVLEEAKKNVGEGEKGQSRGKALTDAVNNLIDEDIDLSGAWRRGMYRKVVVDSASRMGTAAQPRTDGGLTQAQDARNVSVEAKRAAGSVSGEDAWVTQLDQTTHFTHQPKVKGGAEVITQIDDSTANTKQNAINDLINPGEGNEENEASDSVKLSDSSNGGIWSGIKSFFGDVLEYLDPEANAKRFGIVRTGPSFSTSGEAPNEKMVADVLGKLFHTALPVTIQGGVAG